jgi:hypothetical protein
MNLTIQGDIENIAIGDLTTNDTTIHEKTVNQIEGHQNTSKKYNFYFTLIS